MLAPWQTSVSRSLVHPAGLSPQPLSKVQKAQASLLEDKTPIIIPANSQLVHHEPWLPLSSQPQLTHQLTVDAGVSPLEINHTSGPNQPPDPQPDER